MVKVIVLLSRRPDMDRTNFERYFRETHLPLVARMPGLRRLAVNWVLPDPSGSPSDYDAVAEDSFDDLQAIDAAFASAEGEAVAADAPNFLDMSRFRLMIVEPEEVTVPSGATADST